MKLQSILQRVGIILSKAREIPVNNGDRCCSPYSLTSEDYLPAIPRKFQFIFNLSCLDGITTRQVLAGSLKLKELNKINSVCMARR